MKSTEIVEKFNKRFPVGARVRWRNHNAGDFREYTVQIEAADLNGTPVCWFMERTGMVRIDEMRVDYE